MHDHSAGLHTSVDIRRVVRGAALFGAIGGALYLGVALSADAGAVLAALQRLGLGVLITGTAVSSLAYLIRFARWHAILATLGHHLPWRFNLRVYIAGLALTSSPAKLGETVRSLLLLPQGVGLSHSIAAFFTDRLADVLGVALLGAVAGLLSGQRIVILEALAVLGLVGSLTLAAMLRSDRAARYEALLHTHPRLGRWFAMAAAPARAWCQVWRARRVLPYALAAFTAYGLQGLVLGWYVSQVTTGVNIVQAVVIFASSTLLGAASMIPGGLGATEAALVYQLSGAGLSLADATAAAIAIRASTLWFSVLLGSLTLMTFGPTPHRTLKHGARAPEPTDR